MKKQFILLGVLLLSTFSSFGQTGKIILQVKGIQAQKGGEISAGIFTKQKFPKDNQAFIQVEKEVTGKQMTITFNNVPIGEVALAAYQDIDKSKDLKTNFIGFPKEPIGFSRDAPMRFGPPSFKDAKVKVEANKTTRITITLK